MATYKGGKSKSRKPGARKTKTGASGDGKGGRRKLIESTDPIIITGGSLLLEYADTPADAFEPDGVVPGRKRLKHRGNATGRVKLTRIEVYSPAPPANSPPPALPAPVSVIDLRALGINGRCQIRIQYDI